MDFLFDTLWILYTLIHTEPDIKSITTQLIWNVPWEWRERDGRKTWTHSNYKRFFHTDLRQRGGHLHIWEEKRPFRLAALAFRCTWICYHGHISFSGNLLGFCKQWTNRNATKTYLQIVLLLTMISWKSVVLINISFICFFSQVLADSLDKLYIQRKSSWNKDSKSRIAFKIWNVWKL